MRASFVHYTSAVLMRSASWQGRWRGNSLENGVELAYMIGDASSNNNMGMNLMGYANCTVTISNGTASSNPDPVPVSRATQNGVTWAFANDGYTFTGVLIGGVAAPTGDFGTPAISTNAAGRSVMNVSDSVADLGTYSYTLQYTDPQGRRGTYDPTIKNEN